MPEIYMLNLQLFALGGKKDHVERYTYSRRVRG